MLGAGSSRADFAAAGPAPGTPLDLRASHSWAQTQGGAPQLPASCCWSCPQGPPRHCRPRPQPRGSGPRCRASGFSASPLGVPRLASPAWVGSAAPGEPPLGPVRWAPQPEHPQSLRGYVSEAPPAGLSTPGGPPFFPAKCWSRMKKRAFIGHWERAGVAQPSENWRYSRSSCGATCSRNGISRTAAKPSASVGASNCFLAAEGDGGGGSYPVPGSPPPAARGTCL